MLYDIDELAKLQLIPADGAVAEASPGQFEINLHHTDNVLDACDDALALKRLVRLMAEKHKMHATFMAKPYEEHAGSGMHIHISMLNNKGENVLVDGDGEDSVLLKRALAGMIDLMPASMALLVWNKRACRSRSARAMRCGSLCRTIICASASVSVSATFSMPVSMMNYCSLSVLSQKPKLSGC